MSNCRVFSLPIVIRFDVLKNTGLRPAPSPVPFSMNQFDFQGMKEALCDRVIVASGFAPHAPAQTMAP